MNRLKRIILGKESMELIGKLEIIKFKDGKEVSREMHKNLVVNGSGGYGKNIILRKLKNDNTYAMDLKYFCAGTDNTAPSVDDTDLVALVTDSIEITQYEISGNSLVMQIFASDLNLPDGTYREFGIKTSELRLMTRLVPSGSGYVKATGEDTLFIYTLLI